jgi:hypothetical protein
MSEAPLSFTTKIAGDLFTIRGENVDEFVSRLIEVASDERIADAIGDIQSLGGHAPAVAAVKAEIGATVIETTVASAPVSTAGPSVESDKYGAAWTYSHPEAPALPDGRGQYVLKEWTDRNGKARKAFVDPSKGPRPFAKGAVEADIIWL